MLLVMDDTFAIGRLDSRRGLKFSLWHGLPTAIRPDRSSPCFNFEQRLLLPCV